MAIDLVDGRAGTPHIDGDDLGDFKAGFCGTGGYVLKTGDLLEATQDDANHVTVGTGSMIMPGTGRHVRVTSPEQVTVTSGTQGQSRRDLIVMRVTQETLGDSAIETASLVCVRGTPVSYGTPADPAVEDGDLPLYRVSLDGASASEPVAVFDVLTPISELRDSVSQAPRVYTGTTIVSFSEDSETVQVWSSADVQRLFPGVGDFPYVGFSLGDNSFDSWAILGALQVRSGSGQQGISNGDAIFCQSSRATTGLVRLNYVVAGRP